VQKHMIKAALALFLVAALMLVSVAAVASHDSNVKDLRWGGKKNWDIDTVYHTVAVTGMTKDSVTFNILSSAVKGKNGNVSVINHTTPIAVQYYFTNDTAVITGKKHDMMNRTNKTGHRCHMPMVNYNDAKINVAGGSAVIAAKNFAVKKLDNNTTEMSFSAFSVYLPDGTAKSYKLDTPVKMVKTHGVHGVKITGNPQFRADLQDALKGGAKFPANAAPVPLKTIDSKA